MLSIVISFLLGYNVGVNLSKYFYKERTIYELVFAIVLLVLWMIYTLVKYG